MTRIFLKKLKQPGAAHEGPVELLVPRKVAKDKEVLAIIKRVLKQPLD